MADQFVVTGIFVYSERFDAKVGAQLFFRRPLGMFARLVANAPQSVGGSPQARCEDRQDASEKRGDQRRPMIGELADVPSRVRGPRGPSADIILAHTMAGGADLGTDRTCKS